MLRTTTAALFLLLATVTGGTAQHASAAVQVTRGTSTIAAVPFGPGEKVSYRVSWGPIRGNAMSEVVGVDTLRGRPVYHLSFRVRGGALGLNVNDTQESWLDVGRLYSHRFRQDLNQPRYKRLRTLDFFPSEGMWRQVEKPDSGPLASNIPLDDVAFLYWVRTMPLEVGQRYEYNRYFKESGNPVVVQVMRRERVTVPAGTFDAIVVKPQIKTSGLFSEGGEAEIYFSDDEARIVLQMKTKVSIGTLTMQLQEYTPGRRLGASGAPARP